MPHSTIDASQLPVHSMRVEVALDRQQALVTGFNGVRSAVQDFWSNDMDHWASHRMKDRVFKRKYEPCLNTRFLSSSAPLRTCNTRRRRAKNCPRESTLSCPGLGEKRRKI